MLQWLKVSSYSIFMSLTVCLGFYERSLDQTNVSLEYSYSSHRNINPPANSLMLSLFAHTPNWGFSFPVCFYWTYLHFLSTSTDVTNLLSPIFPQVLIIILIRLAFTPGN